MLVTVFEHWIRNPERAGLPHIDLGEYRRFVDFANLFKFFFIPGTGELYAVEESPQKPRLCLVLGVFRNQEEARSRLEEFTGLVRLGDVVRQIEKRKEGRPWLKRCYSRKKTRGSRVRR